MQRSFSIGRIIWPFLFLHASIVMIIAVLLALGGNPSENPALLVIVIGVAAASTLYTANRIISNLNEAIEERVKSVTEFSDDLRTVSENLDRYAKELERRADSIQKRELVLEDKVKIISAYGNRMEELVALIDKVDCKNTRSGAKRKEESGCLVSV